MRSILFCLSIGLFLMSCRAIYQWSERQEYKRIKLRNCVNAYGMWECYRVEFWIPRGYVSHKVFGELYGSYYREEFWYSDSSLFYIQFGNLGREGIMEMIAVLDAVTFDCFNDFSREDTIRKRWEKVCQYCLMVLGYENTSYGMRERLNYSLLTAEVEIHLKYRGIEEDDRRLRKWR